MPDNLSLIETTLKSWDAGFECAPHRFNAREFVLELGQRRVEVGHVHNGSWLDILFSRHMRDILIADGKAIAHPYVPDSGWISFAITKPEDVDHALWLLRLSYLEKVNRYGRGKHHFDLLSEVRALKLSPGLHQAAFPRLHKLAG